VEADQKKWPSEKGQETNMKKLLIATVIAGLGVVGLAAAAQQNGKWQQRRERFLAQHLIHDLNLSDAQRTDIKAILQKEKPAIQAIAGDLEKENAQLRAKPQFDEGFVRSVAQKRNATLTEALVEKEKVRAEIFAVLTPAQQEKANQIGAEMRSMIQERIATIGDQL
jgi:Spy/CpxP family protein refolding chaperone